TLVLIGQQFVVQHPFRVLLLAVEQVGGGVFRYGPASFSFFAGAYGAVDVGRFGVYDSLGLCPCLIGMCSQPSPKAKARLF
ncbi:hypothetical protein, partial [Pseudomonas agarici]|uniref:hypothetical protein n=1 Tax=Pseudomonas agarici TaxID=46677 RepID=UPI000474C4EE